MLQYQINLSFIHTPKKREHPEILAGIGVGRGVDNTRHRVDL